MPGRVGCRAEQFEGIGAATSSGRQRGREELPQCLPQPQLWRLRSQIMVWWARGRLDPSACALSAAIAELVAVGTHDVRERVRVGG